MFNQPLEPIFQTPKYDRQNASDLVTVRMSRKAKKRIKSLKKRKRRTMQILFSQLLDSSSLTFTDTELEGHDLQGRLNVRLTAKQWKRLDNAVERHNTTIYAIVSAIILKGSNQ